ncbi:MAG: T9SS type A sorting domain-containing protein [Chitinophagaceae bacterium]
MKKLYTFLLALCLKLTVFAQLTSGDIAFLHANADAPKDFSWVALVNIAAGTEIFFTEDGWNGTAFYPAITEAHILWTSPIGGITAGTVVNIAETVTANTFTCSHGTAVLASTSTDTWDFSTAGDQILAYTGTVQNPTLFIAGITVDYNSLTYNATTMWSTNGLSNITSSALPPGLTNGVNAIAVINANNGTELDNNRYNCTITSGTKSQLLAAINNYTNWEGHNTTTYTSCATSFTVIPDALPVTLAGFTGKIENEVVQLNWQTAQEMNSSRFEVEHSTNLVTWKQIGTLAAAGNSDILKDYSFVHQNPARGNNYYRLQMTDLDGSRKQSTVVRIAASTKNTIKVYPVPATSYLVLETDAFSQPLPYTITDWTGKIIKKDVLEKQGEHIPVAEFTPGLYLIRLTGYEAVKFLKQ